MSKLTQMMKEWGQSLLKDPGVAARTESWLARRSDEQRREWADFMEANPTQRQDPAEQAVTTSQIVGDASDRTADSLIRVGSAAGDIQGGLHTTFTDNDIRKTGARAEQTKGVIAAGDVLPGRALDAVTALANKQTDYLIAPGGLAERARGDYMSLANNLQSMQQTAMNTMVDESKFDRSFGGLLHKLAPVAAGMGLYKLM